MIMTVCGVCEARTRYNPGNPGVCDGGSVARTRTVHETLPKGVWFRWNTICDWCVKRRTRSHTRNSAGVRVCEEIFAHGFAHGRNPCVCECAACASPRGDGWRVAHAPATVLPLGAIAPHTIVGAVMGEALR